MNKLIIMFVILVVLTPVYIFFKNDTNFSPSVEYVYEICTNAEDNVFKKIDNIKLSTCSGVKFVSTSNFDSIRKLKDKNVQKNAEKYIFFKKNTKKSQIFSKLNTKFSFFQKIDGINILFGYDAKLGEYRIVDGKKVNFQIVETNEEYILGIPVILSSF